MEPTGKIALVIAGSTLGQFEASPQEAIRALLPEALAPLCDVVEWSRQPSSHYTIRLTTDLLEMLRSLVRDGYGGIVVASGTDVMEEMAYLTDLLWPYPQPVVFTGASSPARRSSNEGLANLQQSLIAAASRPAWGLGVLVCSRGELFAASEVAKVYSHRGQDFMAPGTGPVGEVVLEDLYIGRTPRRPAALSDLVIPAKDVELLWASLGGGELILASLARTEGLNGLILGGFGTGNVPPPWIPHLKTLIRRHVSVVVTSRCQMGRVLSLYDFEASAKRLFEMGVLDGGNLRPLQARLRLAVGLGAGMDPRELQSYLQG